MFSVMRWYYPNGIEGETMKCTFRDYEILEKAISYCRRYAKGKRFAGCAIVDEKQHTVFEITSDFEEYCNKEVERRNRPLKLIATSRAALETHVNTITKCQAISTSNRS